MRSISRALILGACGLLASGARQATDPAPDGSARTATDGTTPDGTTPDGRTDPVATGNVDRLRVVG